MPELLSVVIAAKNPPPEQFQLCLTSFSALANAKRLQIIVVNSGEQPMLPVNLTNSFADFTIIDIPPEGVYAAYNAGCEHAMGLYTLFFGADDIALPGMDAVIDKLLFTEPICQMVAAACYMQSVGVAQPSHKRIGLIFANWCHQGIFYQTGYLKSHRYNVHYRIQADHKMNIDIVSNRQNKILISDQVVAYFSAGGVSSVRPDLKFRADFPGIVAHAYGRHWGLLVRIKQLAIDLVKGPPEKRFQSTFRR